MELTQPLQVVVARQDVREGDRLDETMFEIKTFPAKYVQPKAIGEIDQVLGQIASAPISEGEQLMANKLLRSNEAGLAWKVSKGLLSHLDSSDQSQSGRRSHPSPKLRGRLGHF